MGVRSLLSRCPKRCDVIVTVAHQSAVNIAKPKAMRKNEANTNGEHYEIRGCFVENGLNE